MRAAGCGLRVAFIQFMKSHDSHEVRVLKQLPRVTYFSAGPHGRVRAAKGSSPAQARHAVAGLEFALACRETVDLMVCDEILNVPLFSPADPPFSHGDIVDLIQSRPAHLELILTGFACPDAITDVADYASVIQEVKHPFKQGIHARAGIEY